MRRSDYLACYDKGRRLTSRRFVLFVHGRQDGPPEGRVGMAVSKKIGSACVRNRIKRVLRAFFRQHQMLLPVRADLVVVPKRHLRVDWVALASVTGELLPLLENAHRFVCPERDAEPTARSRP